jgi:TPR repeat protein
MQAGAIALGVLFGGMVAIAKDNPFETAAKVAYSGVYDGKDKDGAAYTLVLCERGDAFDGTVSRGGNVMRVEAVPDGPGLTGEMKDANGANPIKIVVSEDAATFLAGSLKVELKRRKGPSFANTFSSENVKIALVAGDGRTLTGSLKFQGRMYDVKARENQALCWGTFAAGQNSWRFTLRRESTETVLFQTGTFAQSLQDEGERKRQAQEAERKRRLEEEVAAMQRRQADERQAKRSLQERRKAEQDAANMRRLALAGDPLAQNDMGTRYEVGNGVTKDPREAAKWYLMAAQRGFIPAQYSLGLLYRYGQGVDRDDATAFEWFRKAGGRGHVKAQLYVGHAYRYGRGVERDDAVALKWYAQAAKRKEDRAQYAMGKMYEEGNGVPKDYAKALAWYRVAAQGGCDEAVAKIDRYNDFVRALPHAKAGDPVAQSEVAAAYTNGDGVEQDYTKALEWYLKAADKQNAAAECGLGDAYYNGWGVPRDRVEAARWYRKAADRGYVEAQVSLGHAYRRGRGVDQDYAKAMEWYRKAVAQGDARGQYHVGRMYEQGLGVPADYEEALGWFRRAADGGYASAKRKMRERDSFLVAKAEGMGGDAVAQRELGIAYADGLGVLKDAREATLWFRRAAEQGDATGQYRLADCYCRGVGVDRNDKEAATWCRKAAEQGQRQAQHLLGVLLHCGRGVVQDDKEAVAWFQKSAAQGCTIALYELGVCYEMGYGVEKDLSAAATWYTKAIANRESDTDLTGWLARARVWEAQGKQRELSAAIETLVRQSPGFPVVYWLRGLGHERQGRLDEALRDYTKAIELLPDYEEPHARRAAIWESRGAAKKALDAYADVLRRNPDWALGYIQRALVRAKAGDKEKAAADCARAIERAPEDAGVLNALAWTYLAQPALRNPAEALTLAKKAAELDGGDSRASVLDTLACAYAANGQFDDAVRTERKAIACLSGDLRSIAELEARLQAFDENREPASLPSFAGPKPPAW